MWGSSGANNIAEFFRHIYGVKVKQSVEGGDDLHPTLIVNMYYQVHPIKFNLLKNNEKKLEGRSKNMWSSV